MFSLFVSAFLLGLIFNAAPGAILAETIRHGLAGGFRPALSVQLGSLAGDATWAVIGLAGIGFLFQIDALRVPITLAGAAYLLWLAWECWQSARHVTDAAGASGGTAASGTASDGTAADGTAAVRAERDRSPARSGAILSLTNPQNVMYWAALGSAMGAVGVAEPALRHYVVFFAAFMTSSVLWCFVCAALVHTVFGRANARWARLTYRTCALALLVLAWGSLRQAL